MVFESTFWLYVLLTHFKNRETQKYSCRLYYSSLSQNLSETCTASFYPYKLLVVKVKCGLHHHVFYLTDSVLYKISVFQILLSVSLITAHPQMLIKGLKVKQLISVLKAQ